MKFMPRNPPRRFRVGATAPIEIADCGDVELAPDEQVTFAAAGGSRYDVVRKDWGYYATPSLNARLVQSGLRSALVRSTVSDRYFVLLVEHGCESAFAAYLQAESMQVVAWLDEQAALDTLRRAMQEPAT